MSDKTDMKFLLIIPILFAIISCSTENGPEPVTNKFTDANTVAKQWIWNDGGLGIYLFSSDTLTFVNIFPNPTFTGVFEYGPIEGTPGTFMNSEFHSNGVEIQLLSAGRLEIRTFTDSYVDFTYDVTYRNGKHLQGTYTGEISKLK